MKPRMIPTTLPVRQPPAWQRALQDAVTDPAELLALLGLGPEWLAPARAAARCLPLKVPRGGDPLTLGDRRLAALFDRLRGLPQVRRIRLHTRLPVVLPYYLHVLDRAAGAAHFDLPSATAQRLAAKTVLPPASR